MRLLSFLLAGGVGGSTVLTVGGSREKIEALKPLEDIGGKSDQESEKEGTICRSLLAASGFST